MCQGSAKTLVAILFHVLCVYVLTCAFVLVPMCFDPRLFPILPCPTPPVHPLLCLWQMGLFHVHFLFHGLVQASACFFLIPCLPDCSLVILSS